MPLPITALYAGLLGILLLGLSANVSRHRRRAQAGIGDGGDRTLARAIRVHGNFTEYVPLALILIALCEIAAAPGWLIHLFGAGLLAGRLLHAVGLSRSAGVSAPRFLGTLLTWLAILAAALAAIYLAWT